MWGYWKDIKSDYESKVKDPWDWVTHFENAIARYAGSKHAIACDSNSNAIRLLIHYFKDIQNRDFNYDIPKNTYVSVPNQLILSNCEFNFLDKKWKDMYRIGNTPIIDAAVSLYEGMYHDTFKTHEDCMVLSFHHRKIIKIGRGGMILTNDDGLNDWLRPMIYDGRNKYISYVEDEFESVGWHMYMTPEEALKGLELFHGEDITSHNQSKGSSSEYKDLSKQRIFKEHLVLKDKAFYNSNGDVVLNQIRIKGIGYNENIETFIYNKEKELDFIEKDWKSTLDSIDFTAIGPESNLVLYENIECNSVSLYSKDKFFNFLLDYFTENRLKHKFIVYGNNLDLKIKKFTYISLPFFLGDSWVYSQPIKERKFKKHFLFLNASPKKHRVLLYKSYKDAGLLENMYYTFNPNAQNLFDTSPLMTEISKKYPNTKKLESDSKLEVGNMHQVLKEYYDSFCNIVTESHFFKDSEHYPYATFITEKTDKCITAGQPFIVASTPFFLKKLKSMGFKTFDKWWDESYDEIEDDYERLKAIEKLTKDISKWSLDKCNTIFKEMIPILRHNQLHLVDNFTLHGKKIILKELVFKDMVKDTRNRLNKLKDRYSKKSII